MPSVGQGNEKVSFPYDAEGIKAAEKYAQAVGGQVDYSQQTSEAPGMRSNISLGYAEGGKIPINNGAERSVQTYAGGGKTGYNIMNRYEEGGKVEEKPSRKKKRSQLIQNDALKAIQDAQAKLNQDKTDGKFGSSKDGDWDQDAFKAAEKVIADKLKAHKANPKNWEAIKKKAKGGKIGHNVMDKYEAGGAVKKAVKKAKKTKPKQKLEKKDNRGIIGEYGSVLDEGGYETEVKSQKTRKFLKAMDKAYKKGKKSKQHKKK